jgi:hypothetical protein
MKTLFNLNNKGLGTIEIILILVVLIGLVIIFREQLFSLIEVIFANITGNSNKILV